MEQSRMLHKLKSMFFKKHIRTISKSSVRAKAQQRIIEIDQEIMSLKQKFHDQLTDEATLVLMNRIHDLKFEKAKLNDKYLLTTTQKRQINIVANRLAKKMRVVEL